MKRYLFMFVLAAGAVAGSSLASAHHSFAAMYDANKPIRLVGKLTKIEWTNPHSFFYIEVTDSRGRINRWTVEGAGPGALSRRGFNRGDIDLGDTLIVQGYLAKSGARIVDGRLVTLPDGRIINGGSPGDGGPGSASAGRSGNNRK
jgi:Family of unknown function (DUF6152)